MTSSRNEQQNAGRRASDWVPSGHVLLEIENAMNEAAPPVITLKEIGELEARLTDSIWIVVTAEGFQDLDSDALRETVSANLEQGIEYRIILADDAAGPTIEGLEDKLLSRYKVQRIPRQLFNIACPFQINDPGKMHRRGFFILRFGSEYFGVEMDRDVLREKIAAFKYLWEMPPRLRQAVRHADQPADSAPVFLKADFAEAVECMLLSQNRAAVILFARCLERLLVDYAGREGLQLEGREGLGSLIGKIRAEAKRKKGSFLADGGAHQTLFALFSNINQFRNDNIHSREEAPTPDAHKVKMIYGEMVVIFNAYDQWLRILPS